MGLDLDPNLAFREFFIDALSADECMRKWQCNIGERRDQLLSYVNFDLSTPCDQFLTLKI